MRASSHTITRSAFARGRRVDAADLLGRQRDRAVVRERREVVEAVRVGDEPVVAERLADLLHPAVEVADVGRRLEDPLAVDLEHDAQHAVRRRVRRAHVEHHPLADLAARPRGGCRRRSTVGTTARRGGAVGAAVEGAVVLGGGSVGGGAIGVGPASVAELEVAFHAGSPAAAASRRSPGACRYASGRGAPRTGCRTCRTSRAPPSRPSGRAPASVGNGLALRDARLEDEDLVRRVALEDRHDREARRAVGVVDRRVVDEEVEAVLARERADRLGPPRLRDERRRRRAVLRVRPARGVVAPRAPRGRRGRRRRRPARRRAGCWCIGSCSRELRAHCWRTGRGPVSTPAFGLLPSTQRSRACAREGAAISPRPSTDASPPSARGVLSGASIATR